MGSGQERTDKTFLKPTKMTEEVSTLDDLQEELKAANENMVERFGTFPMELMTVKKKEVLENNPFEPTSNEINRGNTTHFQAGEHAKKRKFGDHEKEKRIENSQSKNEESQKKTKDRRI